MDTHFSWDMKHTICAKSSVYEHPIHFNVKILLIIVSIIVNKSGASIPISFNSCFFGVCSEIHTQPFTIQMEYAYMFPLT